MCKNKKKVHTPDPETLNRWYETLRGLLIMSECYVDHLQRLPGPADEDWKKFVTEQKARVRAGKCLQQEMFRIRNEPA